MKNILEHVGLAGLVLVLGCVVIPCQALGVVVATAASLIDRRAGINALLQYDMDMSTFPLLGRPGQTISLRTARARAFAGTPWRVIARFWCRVFTVGGYLVGSRRDHCDWALTGYVHADNGDTDKGCGTEFWRWSK